VRSRPDTLRHRGGALPVEVPMLQQRGHPRKVTPVSAAVVTWRPVVSVRGVDC
jgi:hypothetical protein